MTLKEQAIQALKDLHDTEINFCLMDGTLLGAYRDKDFCENDCDDIDIGILDEEYDIWSKELVLKMEAKGYEKFKELIHKGKLEGFGLRKGECHIDVIRINKHPERDECYNIGRTEGEHKIMAFVYPAKHHKKFDVLKFYGLEFKAPHDIEGFLTARYGNWKNKISRPAFNWWEQSNQSSIREQYDVL